MTILWVILAILCLIVLAGIVMGLLGSRIPEEHVAHASVHLKQSPQTVWDLVADAPGHATWADSVTKVEKVADRDGHPAWRQTMGPNSFVLVTIESQPPTRLVRSIQDDKMFSGRWEYDIKPDGDGCTVTITEYGRVPNAMARFMMQFFDPALYAKKHLRSLAKKFGETAEVR